ncbi:nuclear transport factor 2 family protein [Mycobacterium riyadhense]|nr:nuclear transport factor 2 family protein [Mycobacterium riyadhense]
MDMWELVAREQIRDAVARYNWSGDAGRLDEVAETFCAGGVLEIPGLEPLRGRSEIVAFLVGRYRQLTRWRQPVTDGCSALLPLSWDARSYANGGGPTSKTARTALRRYSPAMGFANPMFRKAIHFGRSWMQTATRSSASASQRFHRSIAS